VEEGRGDRQGKEEKAKGLVVDLGIGTSGIRGIRGIRGIGRIRGIRGTRGRRERG
jgi:hypothetical protein